jgi:hypothetical protein
VRDRLEKRGIEVSATTITARAQALGCYPPRPKKKVHDRQVLTTSIGALVQPVHRQAGTTLRFTSGPLILRRNGR